MDYAEHIAYLLGQPHEFAVLVDGLLDALDDPPDMGRAHVLMSGLLLWGWGHGYYQDLDRVTQVMRRIESPEHRAAGPEAPP
jgi:hypothetical protein